MYLEANLCITLYRNQFKKSENNCSIFYAFLFSVVIHYLVAQSAGAVEYTDCFSGEV